MLVTALAASQLKHLLQRAISELVSVESLRSKYLRLCNRAELRPTQTAASLAESNQSDALLRVFSRGERYGSTQNCDSLITLLTAGAGFDWLGLRLMLPRIQPVAERFDQGHSSQES